MMEFSSVLFKDFIDIGVTGIATGVTIGFISWAFGFGIYAVIKWFKMA